MDEYRNMCFYHIIIFVLQVLLALSEKWKKRSCIQENICMLLILNEVFLLQSCNWILAAYSSLKITMFSQNYGNIVNNTN